MSLKKFEILHQLGSGAFATVYKVRRLQDQQVYALKKVKLLSLSQKQKENALNQIRILASIKSPYIISYKQSFLDQETGTLCLITQFADGGDLQNRINSLKEKNQYSEQKQIWSVFIQIAKALKSLHTFNIAHRDLKSANVFLFKNGKVKIGDMNVSKIIKNNLCQTQTGTPYYASPEVWKDIPYNTKSDIWSLGCLIYQLITLHPPFMADNMQGLFKKVLKGIYPKISHKYSKALRNAIRMMLHVDPESRPCINNLLQFAQNNCKKLFNQKFFDQLNERGPESSKNIQQVSKLTINDKENQEEDCISLLGTIRLPRKIAYLGPNLPKPNYSQSLINGGQGGKKISMKILPSLEKVKQNSVGKQKDKLLKVRSQKLLPLPLISNKILSN